MNGMVVQDETLKADGRHSGSIRQYSARWYVHYFSSVSAPASLSTWEGGMMHGEINLQRPQKSHSGRDGKYKIRFYNISDKGIDWLGAWMTIDESIVWKSWKIPCDKRSP